MKTLLRIDTSMRRDGSQSRMLADYYEALWKNAHPTGHVVTRDLAREPVPHLTDEAFAAFREPAGGAGGASLSDVLIQELMDADHLLIGAPMYNFAMPSPLKAWLDHVVRSGRTFRVQGDTYSGLLAGKSATVLTARGAPETEREYLSNYLQDILGFIGIEAVDVIDFEGTGLDPSSVVPLAAEARCRIEALFAGAGAPQWVGDFSAEEKRGIEALRDAQAQAIVAGDAGAYAQLCTDDVRLMIPGHDIVAGRAQFHAAERRLFSGARFGSFLKYADRIERSGDMVVETGRQDVRMERSGSNAGVFAARQKYTHVMRWTRAGWRYAVLMSNACE